MTDSQYRLTLMQNTQSISVRWGFSQNDYDKLTQGHQSNWSIFLRGDVVRVCRPGGEEFYRFTVNKTNDGYYEADSLEVYVADEFYESARRHGWSEEEIERHQAELRISAVEESAGLLATFFDINVV